MSAIGVPHGRGFVMSACADYRLHHLLFERQQSLDLRQMEWEGRLKPMAPWSALVLRGTVMLALAAILLAMLGPRL